MGDSTKAKQNIFQLLRDRMSQAFSDPNQGRDIALPTQGRVDPRLPAPPPDLNSMADTLRRNARKVQR